MATSVMGEWSAENTPVGRGNANVENRYRSRKSERGSLFIKRGSVASTFQSPVVIKPRRRISILSQSSKESQATGANSLARRRSSVRSVSSSIASFLARDEDAGEDEAMGLLVDFHRRLSAPDREKDVPERKKLKGKDDDTKKHAQRKIQSADSRRKSRAPANSTVLTEVRAHAGAGLASAVEAICYDMLYARIMKDVTIFWKSVDHPDWTTDCNMLLSWAHTVNKYNTKASGLNAEVGNWVWRHTFIHARPLDSEDAQDRHGRLQQFWADFHESSWKMEPRAMRPPFKDDLRRRVYRDNMDDLPPDPANTRKTLRSRNGLSSSATSLHDITWQNRSVRSHVSAGQWGWATGSGLGRSTPSQPTKRRHVHWSTSLFGLENEELEEYYDPPPEEEGGENEEATSPTSPGSPPEVVDNTFLTGMSSSRPPTSEGPFRPITPEISRSSTPSMGKKAASLPNLKKLSAAFGPEASRPASVQSLHSFQGNIADGGFLPPVTGKFSVPWQYASPTPILKCVDSPTKRYLRACQKDKSIPRPLPFITGHSLNFNASGQSLFDKDLQAVTVTLEDVGIEEVDLTGNTNLTEHSLIKFTQALSQPPAAPSLKKLVLKRVHNAGQKVLNIVVKTLGNPEGIANLCVLDLTDVSMNMKSHLPFAKAVRDHAALKTLSLVNTGVGSGMDVKKFVYDLLGSESLEKLDLGWNCFTADVLSLLGDRHVQMQKLKQLSLSNCAAAPRPGNATVMVYFLEHLARDKKLRSLDVSLNRMDFRAALVLEDALQRVKTLTDLNISNNPFGVLGMRSLLRLLCCDTSGLISFDCSNCSNGSHSDFREGMQVYRKTTPGGRYTLELDRPYHRSLLRMLYKTSEHFGLDPGDSFTNLTYSLPPWVHAKKDKYDVWLVPPEGVLTATFSVDQAVNKMVDGGLKENLANYDFEEYTHRYLAVMRTIPGRVKVIPLFAQWRRIEGHTPEQHVFLDALAKDFILSYPQIVQLCTSRSVISEILSRLIGCIQGAAERYLSMTLVSSFTDAVRMLTRIKPLLTFNLGNPTGRYKLHLSNHSEYQVAENLLLLDRWEQGVNLRSGRPDVSQRGNYSVLRNEKYCHRPMSDLVKCMSEWILPEHDLLEFDFSSGRRPPRDAQPLDDVSFSNIMVTLENSDCSYTDKLTALRMASHTIYVTALQLRSLMGNFDDMEALVEMIVLFFVRVIDMHNEKVFRVRIEDQFLMEQLRKRLGYIAMFPFIQPEQARFHLEFGVYETRIVANMLMNLSKMENVHNLRDPIYIKEDGKRDWLPQGIYRSWEVLDKMPRGGYFDISYVNAPENRNFEFRKQLFESYGHWNLTAEEDQVMWWASLTEAPADALEFCEFLIAKYENPKNAYKEIVKICNTEIFTKENLQHAYKEMKCDKFSGKGEKDEMDRITAVFRWLDVSSEGTVSGDEFGMLDLLFKEIEQSISEFVGYCERAFWTDGDDDSGAWLEKAWHAMDDDKSGEIDSDEWHAACAKIRYCGPIAPIFNYLDQDDEGHISWEEFQALTKFQKENKKASVSESSPSGSPHEML